MNGLKRVFETKQNVLETGISQKQVEEELIYINKVKKQKEKVQMLAQQFQQQQQLIAERDKIIEELIRKRDLILEQNLQFYHQEQKYIFAISQKQQEIEQLKANINSLVHQCKSLYKEKQEQKEQLRLQQLKINNKKQVSVQTFDVLKTEIDKINLQLKNLSARFKTKCEEVEELHRCLELASTTITKLQADVIKNKKANQFQSQQHQNLFFKHQHQINQVTEELKQCKLYLISLQNQNTALQGEKQKLTFQIQKQVEDIAEKTKVIEKLENSLVTYCQEIKIFQQEILERESLIERLHLKIEEQQRVDNIKKQLYYQREKQSNQLNQLIAGFRVKRQ